MEVWDPWQVYALSILSSRRQGHKNPIGFNFLICLNCLAVIGFGDNYYTARNHI